MDKKVDIIKDVDDKSIVVINNLRFKGRRSVDWDIVESENYHKSIMQMPNLAGTGMIHVLRFLFIMMMRN